MTGLSKELKQRWTYAMLATAILLLSIFVLGQEFSFLVALFCGVWGWREYARMMGLVDRPSLHYLGYGFVVLMYVHAFFVGPRTLFWLWAAWTAAFFTLFFEYWREKRANPASPPEDIDVNKTWAELCRFVMGILYIFLMFGFVGPVISGPKGEQILFLTFSVVFLGDTGAYFVGRKYGRRKLWPALSPKKTIEGAIGGYAGSIVGAFCIWLIFWAAYDRPVPFSTYLTMALILPPFAQAGDFLESLMKRAAGRKDSGSLLPGHGGLLDRADGLALAMPVVYFLIS